MDSRDIGSRAEQYKNELMKLYGQRKPDSEAQNEEDCHEKANALKAEVKVEEKGEMLPEKGEKKENIGNEVRVNEEDSAGTSEKNTENEPEEVTKGEDVPKTEYVPEEREEYDEDTADAEHDTSYYPYTGDEELKQLEQNFPDPDISEFEEIQRSEQPSDESLGNSTGYILVNVRTGRDSAPIVGASVMVTAISEGNRYLIAAGITDISGATLKLEAPAPNEALSQIPDSEVRPYSLFDISVIANGYFNARSVDVPVFSGITSIQNFNMIPVPIMMNSGDETLTYFNQEPNFG